MALDIRVISIDTYSIQLLPGPIDYGARERSVQLALVPATLSGLCVQAVRKGFTAEDTNSGCYL